MKKTYNHITAGRVAMIALLVLGTTQPAARAATVSTAPPTLALASNNEIPASPAAPATTAVESQDKVGAALSTCPPARAEDLRIELTPAGKATEKNQVKVQLALKSVDALAALPLVQDWRLARADGTVFMFGHLRHLTTDLPLGTYTVTVRARPDAEHLAVCVSNTVEITHQGIIQRTPVAVLVAAN